MGVLPGSSRARGFTLLEVLAAVAILGFGLATLYAGYYNSARIEAKEAEGSLALILARGKLAEAEAGALSGTAGDFESATGYAWQLTKEPLPDGGLARLTITVTWGEGNRRAVEVWTLVADAGS
jgi:prepilin-type N-terminal cleavage/methylation domain-containing protein